jgi:hypothetical protein
MNFLDTKITSISIQRQVVAGFVQNIITPYNECGHRVGRVSKMHRDAPFTDKEIKDRYGDVEIFRDTLGPAVSGRW